MLMTLVTHSLVALFQPLLCIIRSSNPYWKVCDAGSGSRVQLLVDEWKHLYSSRWILPAVLSNLAGSWLALCRFIKIWRIWKIEKHTVRYAKFGVLILLFLKVSGVFRNDRTSDSEFSVSHCVKKNELIRIKQATLTLSTGNVQRAETSPSGSALTDRWF